MEKTTKTATGQKKQRFVGVNRRKRYFRASLLSFFRHKSEQSPSSRYYNRLLFPCSLNLFCLRAHLWPSALGYLLKQLCPDKVIPSFSCLVKASVPSNEVRNESLTLQYFFKTLNFLLILQLFARIVCRGRGIEKNEGTKLVLICVHKNSILMLQVQCYKLVKWLTLMP